MSNLVRRLFASDIQHVCALCQDYIEPKMLYVDENTFGTVRVIRKMHLTCFDMRQHGHTFQQIPETQIK